MSHALVFDANMHEVTGFGGEYEQRTRAAIEIGAEWLRNYCSPGSFDHAELEKYIRKHEMLRSTGRFVAMGKLLTRTQMALAMYHLRFIATYGWDAYREKMSSDVKFTEGAA